METYMALSHCYLNLNKAPLLIGTARTGPLDNGGSIGGGSPGYIGILPTFLIDQGVVPIACGNKVPPLIRAVGIVPLIQSGPIRCGAIGIIEEQTTIDVDQLVATIDGGKAPLLIRAASRRPLINQSSIGG